MRSRSIIGFIMLGSFVLIGIVVMVILLTGSASSKSTSYPMQQERPKIVVANGLQGRMIGTVIKEGGTFRGIPFSEPPIGEHRWRKPRTPVPFINDVWNATYFRPGCPQRCTYKSKKYTCPEQTDEDCLYLNIWVPTSILQDNDDKDDVIRETHYVISDKYQHGDDESLAVMVYLHGGNFQSGAGSAKIYDGRFIANQGNVIVVTTNYRLGALGFLVQSGGGADGNYGMWDQIAALKWVQENIKFFGGNPKKVTLFGQSSGAESIGVLMTSDLVTNKLFQQSIMSSNPLSLPLRDRRAAEEYGSQFAQKLECASGNMACLRAAKVDAILDAMDSMPGFSLFGGGKKLLVIQPWGPVIDGDFLKEPPLQAFEKGRAKEMPTIIGATVDEGMYFVSVMFSQPIYAFTYHLSLGVLLGDKSTPVFGKYPARNDTRYQIGKIITDYIFICPERAAAFGSTSQTWFYIFNQTLPFKDIWNSKLCYDKVCHGADLPYVFNTVNLSSYKLTDEEELLAKRMVYYWTNFAKYGNPNGETEISRNGKKRESNVNGGKYGSTFWPRFSADNFSSYSAIKFESKGDKILSDPYYNTCEFWDGIDSYGKFR